MQIVPMRALPATSHLTTFVMSAYLRQQQAAVQHSGPWSPLAFQQAGGIQRSLSKPGPCCIRRSLAASTTHSPAPDSYGRTTVEVLYDQSAAASPLQPSPSSRSPAALSCSAIPRLPPALPFLPKSGPERRSSSKFQGSKFERGHSSHEGLQAARGTRLRTAQHRSGQRRRAELYLHDKPKLVVQLNVADVSLCALLSLLPRGRHACLHDILPRSATSSSAQLLGFPRVLDSCARRSPWAGGNLYFLHDVLE